MNNSSLLRSEKTGRHFLTFLSSTFFSLVISSRVLGYALFQPGASIADAASLGLLSAKSSAAYFHNPALGGLVRATAADWDFQPTYLQHEFKHPAYADSFSINAVAPVLSFGINSKLPRNLAVGIGIFPRGLGKSLLLEEMPLDVSPTEAEIVNVTTADLSIETALGMAARITRIMYLGLSVVSFTEHRRTRIEFADTGAPLFDARYRGQNWQPRIGGLLQPLPNTRLGWKYHHPVAKTYQGSVAIGEGGEKEPVDTKEYLPMALGLAASRKFGRWTSSAEIMQEWFRTGRKDHRLGYGSLTPKETALVDALSVGVNMGYVLANMQPVNFGVSYISGNLGTGTNDGSGGVDNRGVDGMKVGGFDAIDRIRVGAGTHLLVFKTRYHLVAYYAGGVKSVKEGTPGQGRYSLHALSVGIGSRVGI